MFAGIVEAMGTVAAVESDRGNQVFWIAGPFTDELKIDQSIAHDGVCLTVEEIVKAADRHKGELVTQPGIYRVSAIAETLAKTSMGTWQAGRAVNLERCLAVGDRIDGHFVQGHVDTTGTVRELREHDGSWEIFVEFPEEFEELIVPKGSICINGVSLTVVASDPDRHIFSVHIIPYTMEHTNLKQFGPGDAVNLEFDVLGKYIQKMVGQRVQAG